MARKPRAYREEVVIEVGAVGAVRPNDAATEDVTPEVTEDPESEFAWLPESTRREIATGRSVIAARAANTVK